MIEEINNKISDGLILISLGVAYITILTIDTIKYILK